MVIMHLRKAAIHPYLFSGVEKEGQDEFGEHIIQTSGKMQMIDKLLKKLKTGGHRCLIFSQFKIVLDILEDFCMLREYNYCRLDGDNTSQERQEDIDEFCKKDEETGEFNSDKFIFLISTRAGGLGLNLVAADTVIIFDSHWNPQCDLQAMDRYIFLKIVFY